MVAMKKTHQGNGWEMTKQHREAREKRVSERFEKMGF
jgi:hypothetical protein